MLIPRSLSPKIIFYILSFFSLNAFLQGCKKDFVENPASVKSNSVDASAKKLRPATSKPNVIIILVDDMGYEVPTYSGGQSYQTPTLDYLAANGMQFRQAYCHPDGFPSRLALYTGKYNFRNYIHWAVLPPDAKTVGNLMKDAGYATCFIGKWQCGGGDPKIRNAGYDKYRCFDAIGDEQRIGRYKNPIIYENAQYLPDSITNGKFSEDMFVDYLDDFIDSNVNNPFFVVYANNLVAGPYVPDPDNPDYPFWNPNHDEKFDVKFQDPKYFNGMVKYMDKKVGQVIQKLNDAGILQNTLILVTSDNATQEKIFSQFKGQTIQGQKKTTTRAGTNISFLAYWPGTILPGQVSNELVNFTDFLPTLADVAGTTISSDYGTTDGVSIYDNMLGIAGKDRDFSYCYWDNVIGMGDPPVKFVNNQKYKLYQENKFKRFYNIQKDIFETNPIPDSLLTPAEQQIKLDFEKVLIYYRNQH